MARNHSITEDERRVAAAIDWASRNGYVYADDAALALCRLTGLDMVRESLGLYGDKMVFNAPPRLGLSPRR